MIKIVVDIEEIKKERDAVNIAFRIDEEHPTEIEKFWEGRLSPVLKKALKSAFTSDGPDRQRE